MTARHIRTLAAVLICAAVASAASLVETADRAPAPCARAERATHQGETHEEEETHPPIKITPQAPEQSPVEPSAPPEETTEPARHRDDIVSEGRLLSYELQEVMQDCCERYEVPYALALAIAERNIRSV